jgi:chromosome segregation ATPase
MVFGNYDENIKEYNSKIAAIEKEIATLRPMVRDVESILQEKKDKRDRLEKEFDTYVKKEEEKVEEKLKDLGMKAQRAQKYLDMAKDNVNDCVRDLNNYPTQQDFYQRRLYNAKKELNIRRDEAEDAESAFNREKVRAKSKAMFTNERTKKISETIDNLNRKIPRLIKEIQKVEDMIKKKEDRIHKIQEHIRQNELMKHYVKEAEMKKKAQEPLVEKLPKESPKKKSPKKKTVKSAPTKKKCPKGSKLNKKTGRCNKNKPKNKSKRSRCPNGSRKNPKTGNCEKK